jgi:hypothetical protein
LRKNEFVGCLPKRSLPSCKSTSLNKSMSIHPLTGNFKLHGADWVPSI